MRRGMGPQSRAAPERRCHQADWRCARCARAWPLWAGQLVRGPSDGAAQGGVSKHGFSMIWNHESLLMATCGGGWEFVMP